MLGPLRRNRVRSVIPLVLCGLLGLTGLILSSGAPVLSQESAPTQEAAATPAPGRLGPEELRPLVAPIALYPDDLLAIVLPASAIPVQIVEAQRFLDQRKKDEKLQPNADWDPAVLALLNYPEVIAKMNADLEWTKALGNAVINQLQDVMEMIQQLRAEAQASGYLQSNAYWLVVWEDDYWHIDSYDPDYIYVPDYPDEIFERPAHPIVKPPPVQPGLKPEHPIVLPPGQSGPRPEHPIVVPPPGGVHVENPIAYPPPTYATHYPYWSPGAVFFAGAFVGAAFGYGLNWGGGDIDINYGSGCCGGRNNINIGNGGNRATQLPSNVGDRFNADRQRVNGGDKLKWNGNKARQKQATGQRGAGKPKAGTLPARNGGAGATGRQPGLGGQGQTQRPGDLKSTGSWNSSLGSYGQSRDANRLSNQGRQSLQNQRSRPQSAGPLSSSPSYRSRSNAGAFGGYGGGSSISRQSSRGRSSFGSRPTFSRGGGGGRRR